jgi:nucleoside phosphorylase
LTVLILVPQGAEFNAVRSGLSRCHSVSLLPTPVGKAPVASFLEQFADKSIDRVFVMGLCGSLRSDLAVGTTVTYQRCQDESGQVWPCEVDGNVARVVTGWTSDRVICTAVDKQALADRTNADVVDMEGTAIAAFFAAQKIPVTMLRVVSDDVSGDIPDLTQAFDAQGNLRPWGLGGAFVRQPIAAARLIRGSLLGLGQLKKIAALIKFPD